MIKHLKYLKKNIKIIESSLADIENDSTGLLDDYKDSMVEHLTMELKQSKTTFNHAIRNFIFTSLLMAGLAMIIISLFISAPYDSAIIVIAYAISMIGVLVVSMNARDIEPEKTRNRIYALYALPVAIYSLAIAFEVLKVIGYI